jgi:fructose-1,6-bisphosphatase/sedoheptulose 1,7-bisphosphatase-like protein
MCLLLRHRRQPVIAHAVQLAACLHLVSLLTLSQALLCSSGSSSSYVYRGSSGAAAAVTAAAAAAARAQ